MTMGVRGFGSHDGQDDMSDWKIENAVFEEMPIFPLKNAHLFPGAVLPLHIFEPRYIEMIEFALNSGSNAIAIASLNARTQTSDSEAPAVNPIMGAGLIFAAEKLEGGRWNVLVRGVTRIRMVEENEQVHLFRTIRSVVESDVNVPMDHPLHAQLRSLLGQLGDAAPEAREVLNLIMAQGNCAASLTNLLGAHATSDPTMRQRMLNSVKVEERLRIAVKHIGRTLLERLNPPENPRDTLH